MQGEFVKMKVKTIESIKEYGIFTDYNSNGIKEFSVNNIIFGWNYSGKTTISRIFRCLERKELHTDFAKGKFKIILDNDNVVTEKEVPENNLKIRVFNSDYIKDNIEWDLPENTVKPILIVGERDISLKKSLNRIKEEKASLELTLKNKQDEKLRLKKELEADLSREASRITDELSLGRNFRRPELEKMIDKLDLDDWIIPEEEVDKVKISALESYRLEPIDKVRVNIDKNIIYSTEKLLQKTVTPSNTIERLKNNFRFEEWVRKGIELHTEESTCIFCGSNLASDLFDRLDSHFSKDYEDFRSNLEEHMGYLKTKKIDIDLKNRNDFFAEYHSEYDSIREELNKNIKSYNNTVVILVEKANEKLHHLIRPINLGEITINFESLENIIKKLNELIEKHNSKALNFNRDKDEAKEKLKKHYVAKFYINHEYAAKTEVINTIENEVNSLSEDASKKEKEIFDIDTQRSESARGAALVTKYMKRYFGNNSPIAMEAQKEGGFQIYRGREIAKNLSEGEKTAISFSHFLACMDDKETKSSIKDTIVYIDDPVSSLDSNHLFNTYALIATVFKDKCGQLFV